MHTLKMPCKPSIKDIEGNLHPDHLTQDSPLIYQLLQCFSKCTSGSTGWVTTWMGEVGPGKLGATNLEAADLTPTIFLL